MSESTRVIPQIEETDTELELSTEELLELAQLDDVDEHEVKPALQPSTPAKSASPPKLSLLLSVIVTIGLVGTTYVVTSSNGATLAAANTSHQIAQREWPAPEQIAKGEPVRFANPFDADEVFEFPEGTTESQARDAVAEVLMKRALSRQKT